MFSKSFHIEQQPINETEAYTSRVLAYGPGLLMMEWSFEKAGAVTPMHDHYHEQLTHVVKGSVKITLADDSEEVFTAGEAVYFAPYEKHAVVTLEDNTVVVDVFNPLRLDHLEKHHLK